MDYDPDHMSKNPKDANEAGAVFWATTVQAPQQCFRIVLAIKLRAHGLQHVSEDSALPSQDPAPPAVS